MSTPLQPRQWSLPGMEANTGQFALGQIRKVKVADIEFSQHEVDHEKVSRMAAKKKAGHSMPMPIASMAGGKVKIQDGHHRALADIENGAKEIDVRVF